MTIAHGKDLRLGLYFQTEQFSEFISTICTYVSKSTTVNKNGEFFCLAPSTTSFMGALHMLTGSMLYFVPLPGSDMLPCTICWKLLLSHIRSITIAVTTGTSVTANCKQHIFYLFLSALAENL